MRDAWVWDMYRPARFVKTVRVLTFKDVNIEELDKPDLELPGQRRLRQLTDAVSSVVSTSAWLSTVRSDRRRR